jgi:hypothetical protein
MFDSSLCSNCHERLITEEEEAVASTMTIDQVFLEGVNTLIQIAHDNDMPDAHIDIMLEKILDRRAGEIRKGFKIH